VSRARDVVEVIARTLAARPEEVRVSQIEHRGKTIIELFMAPGELGRVIGRQGRTATAIRTLASTAAEIDGAKVSVEFVDD
jgi:uncharacterized protein